MGLNTTIVILNDALGEIERDPSFGKKLTAAIRKRALTREVETISAGAQCNAAMIIETHHSSETALVAVGGNTGNEIFLSYRNLVSDEEELLQEASKALLRL